MYMSIPDIFAETSYTEHHPKHIKKYKQMTFTFQGHILLVEPEWYLSTNK